ncbi:MAG: hypothetical protein U1F35_07505 [Steroidobacteraceae bacterium]
MQRFDNVSGVLVMPPGHRLLAALGADSAPQAWVEQWRLLDLFLLLITAAIALRLFGAGFAAVTLLAVALVHHENASLVWLLLAVLVSLAILRVAPEGKPRVLASWARTALLALLLVVLVPFAISQVRYALYPQLADRGEVYPASLVPMAAPRAAGAPRAEEIVVTATRRDSAPPPVQESEPSPVELDEMETQGAADASALQIEAAPASAAKVENPYGMSLSSERSYQGYAPGTLVQAGPGRPRWNFVSYEYSWAGPVEAAQSVRFVILPTLAMSAWRVLGVALLALVFVVLARSGDDLRAQWRRLLAMRGITATILVLLSLLGAGTGSVRAAATPDAQALNELRNRLTRPPECLPSCPEVLRPRVAGAGQPRGSTRGVGAHGRGGGAAFGGEPLRAPTR